MTVNENNMLRDLGRLSPEEKIEFMLSLATHLIPLLRVMGGASPQFAKIYEEYESVIAHGRRWLRGEIADPNEVVKPVDWPSRRPFYSLELDHKGSQHYWNLRVVGSMVMAAIHYAGERQFEKFEDVEVPQSLEEKFTDQELVDNFERTLDPASSEVQAEFEAFWKQYFGS